ncbi:hypothetical protein F442_12590, partial [Phytophthora nicotianae P10297]
MRWRRVPHPFQTLHIPDHFAALAVLAWGATGPLHFAALAETSTIRTARHRLEVMTHGPLLTHRLAKIQVSFSMCDSKCLRTFGSTRNRTHFSQFLRTFQALGSPCSLLHGSNSNYEI